MSASTGRFVNARAGSSVDGTQHCLALCHVVRIQLYRELQSTITSDLHLVTCSPLGTRPVQLNVPTEPLYKYIYFINILKIDMFNERRDVA